MQDLVRPLQEDWFFYRHESWPFSSEIIAIDPSFSSRKKKIVDYIHRAFFVDLEYIFPDDYIYWADEETQNIQRAHKDGMASVEDLVTSADGLGGPLGLAINHFRNKIYWWLPSNGKSSQVAD